jgi:hypothetical protein
MRKSCGSFIALACAQMRNLAVILLCALPLAGRAGETPALGYSPADQGSEVVLRALGMLGVPYVYGGDSPETGFDCSGLVRHVFGDAAGVSLPRRAQEIESAGADIGRSEMQPGDLVFFNTQQSPFSHVGIYIGDQRFVHAPTAGGVVRIESLEVDYWNRRFDGARRLLAQASLAPALATRPAASESEALALMEIQGDIFRASFLR